MSLPSTQKNAAELYIQSLSARTGRLTMSSTLNRVAQILGGNNLSDYDWSLLDAPQVEYLKNYLVDEDLSPATINKYLAALRGVAKQAWVLGDITHEAYLHIKLVKNAKGSRIMAGRALENKEILRLYRSIDRSDLVGKRNLSILVLMVECGLRRSDVKRLNCGDINWEEFFITFKAKGNKERKVYLTRTACEYLTDFYNAHPFRSNPDHPLFFRIFKSGRPANTRLSDGAINYILNALRVSEGVKRFSPHDLRRTFATHLFDIGVDVKMVKDAMDHENIATTMKYDRRKLRRTKELMQNISYDDND